MTRSRGRRWRSGALLLAALSIQQACDRAPDAAPNGGSPSAERAMALPGDARQRAESQRAAEEYLSAGRFNEALLITSRLVRVAPEGAAEHELHARTLLAIALAGPAERRHEALQRAAAAYLDAARLDPVNAPLQQAVGVTLDQAGRLEEALTRYQEAARLDATEPQYALYEGLALRRLGRFEAALAALERARDLDPEEPKIRVACADTLLVMGRPQEALGESRVARRLAPADLTARIVEARSLRALERSLEAAELLSMLSEADRANEAVALELAESLRAIGRPQEAARAWEHSLASDPRRWRSALGAAECWLEAGDLLRAGDRASLAASLAPASERESLVRPLEARIVTASIGRAPP